MDRPRARRTCSAISSKQRIMPSSRLRQVAALGMRLSNKTVTEDYYLLTLAAIAKELAHRGAEPTAAVHLAAGLPLTSGEQGHLRDGDGVGDTLVAEGHRLAVPEQVGSVHDGGADRELSPG